MKIEKSGSDLTEEVMGKSEELKEEAKARRRCLEEMVAEGRCAGAGEEREDGERTKESKGKRKGSKEEIVRKKDKERMMKKKGKEQEVRGRMEEGSGKKNGERSRREKRMEEEEGGGKDKAGCGREEEARCGREGEK